MPTWRNAPPATPGSTSGPEPVVAPVRGLVRRPASAPAFRVERYPVGAELEPWFEHLWTVEWDLAQGDTYDSTVISFPALHLTVEWGTPGEVRHGALLPATLVHGAVSRVFRVRLRGAGGVVGARFAPGGFRAFTGADASALRDRAVPAAEVVGPVLGALHESLVGLPVAEAAGRFAARLVEQRSAQAPDTDLSDLLRRMADDAELVRVEQLVELSGISKRTLQRRFSAALGVSPKWVLARFRLQEAALAIEREPATDLTELALRLGWYDQAHLTNDFRRMLGETPGRYAARAR